MLERRHLKGALYGLVALAALFLLSAASRREWVWIVLGALCLVGAATASKLLSAHGSSAPSADKAARKAASDDLVGTDDRRSFRGTTIVASSDDDEQALSDNHMVVVRDRDRLKWLRFICPCGCGEMIALNLMKRYAPRWSIEHHSDGTLSVSPSVDSTTCGAHFWIRQSRVHWVGPMTTTPRRESSS